MNVMCVKILHIEWCSVVTYVAAWLFSYFCESGYEPYRGCYCSLCFRVQNTNVSEDKNMIFYRPLTFEKFKSFTNNCHRIIATI